MAQRDAEHADLAATSAIFQLKSTMKTEDAFLLFKGMMDKDEDLDPNVRDRMMKRSREHFFAFGEENRHLLDPLAVHIYLAKTLMNNVILRLFSLSQLFYYSSCLCLSWIKYC